ncbi:MAG: HD-GYP domain-containing protein [Bacteroidetes bacterium]|nr:HD-GYP domain-containing protein [Bacteroidota bacterium]
MEQRLTPTELGHAKLIFEQLVAVKRKTMLYPPQHPELIDAFQRLTEHLGKFLEKRPELTIAMHEADLFIGSELMMKESVTYKQFIRECEDIDVGGITFLKGLGQDELEAFVDCLCMDRRTLENEGGVAERLKTNKVIHVVVASSSQAAEKDDDDVEHHAAKEVYNSAVTAVTDIMNSVKVGQSVNVIKAEKTVNTLIDAIFGQQLNILGLTAIKSYDETTFYHSVNTCILSISLGGNLSLAHDKLAILGTAALLHDIGKVNVPVEITTKPGPLTSEEFEVMKRHTSEGAEILSDMRGMHRLSMIVAFEHHAGYDLRGYPKLNDKQRPHLFSRIVQVCDSYDAGTSFRPFKGGKLPDQVLAEMIRQSGQAFDPVIMKAFVQTLSIYPVGSLVLLDSGDVAVVIKSNPKDLARPSVKVAIDEGGVKADPKDAKVLDLVQRVGKGKPFKRSVIKVVDPWELGIDVVQFF